MPFSLEAVAPFSRWSIFLSMWVDMILWATSGPLSLSLWECSPALLPSTYELSICHVPALKLADHLLKPWARWILSFFKWVWDNIVLLPSMWYFPAWGYCWGMLLYSCACFLKHLCTVLVNLFLRVELLDNK